MHRLLLVLLALVASAPAFAADLYEQSAAGVGGRHFGVQLGTTFGPDPRIAETDQDLGFSARIDLGLTDRLDLGIWIGEAQALGGTCIDYAAESPYPSDCFTSWSAGAGLAARIGLVRFLGFQAGLELGVQARRLRETGLEDLSLGLDTALLASQRLGPVGLAYLRGGFGWSRLDDEVRVSVRRQPYATLGLELLPGRIHPFLQGSFSWLMYPYLGVSEPKTHELGKVSVTAGVSAAF